MKNKNIIGIVAVLILLIAIITNLLVSPPDYFTLINNLSEDELIEIENVRFEAYQYALTCSDTNNPVISYDEIKWQIWPDRHIEIPTESGLLILGGWYNVETGTIFVAYPDRKTPWINAHEALHAIGVLGHPVNPFMFPCRLTAEQNS